MLIPTSPKSIEACFRLGIDPLELAFKPVAALRKGGESDELAELRFQHHEQLRQASCMMVLAHQCSSTITELQSGAVQNAAQHGSLAAPKAAERLQQLWQLSRLCVTHVAAECMASDCKHSSSNSCCCCLSLTCTLAVQHLPAGFPFLALPGFRLVNFGWCVMPLMYLTQ